MYSIVAIFVMCTNLRAAITSVSPLLTDIERDLSLNAATVSLLTSLPVFCMGVFAPLASNLGQRLGLSRTIFWSVALIGVATLLRFTTNSAPLLLTTALFAGLGIAVAGPVMSGYIKMSFPTHAPLVVGVYTGGLGIGATLSSGLSIPLQRAFHNSWHWSLSFWALFAVLGLVVWFPLVRRSHLERVDYGTQMHSSQATRQRGFGMPWRESKAWMLVLIFGFQSGIYYVLATFLPPLFEQRGLAPLAAGDVMTVFSLVNMATGILLPFVLRLSRSRLPWLIGCGALMMFGLILIALLPHSVNPWLTAILLGLGSGGSFTLTLILPLDFTKSGEEASSWTAMMQFGGYILSGIVPILAGVMRDSFGNYEAVMWFLFAFSVLFTIISLSFRHKRVS